MLVYINWETQEVLGPREVEEKIDEKYQEYANDACDFDDYLIENYTIPEIWRMDEAQRDEVLEKYYNYCRSEAENWFDREFCEYEVK